MEPGQQPINKTEAIAGARLLLLRHNVANFGVRKNHDELLKRRELVRLFAQFLQRHPHDRFVAHPAQKKITPLQAKKKFLEPLILFMKKLKMRVRRA